MLLRAIHNSVKTRDRGSEPPAGRGPVLQRAPAVALLDVQLPLVDGVRTARLLKRVSATCRVPLIAPSAGGGPCVRCVERIGGLVVLLSVPCPCAIKARSRMGKSRGRGLDSTASNPTRRMRPASNAAAAISTTEIRAVVSSALSA
jgi:hypothetical protein